MTRTFAAFFIAYYAVRIAVFVFRVMPGTLEKPPAEYESKAWMRGLPVVLLVTDSLLPPALILWRVGELEVLWLPVRWLGVLLSLSAAGISLWAVRSLGRFFVPQAMLVPDQVFITTGPYRLVRHPAYLGDLAMWAGAALGTCNWLLLALWPLLLFGLRCRVREEERLLALKFGDTFQEYAAKTGRLFPRIRRSRPQHQGSPDVETASNLIETARPVRDLYTRRVDAYLAFNTASRYAQSLRAFFKGCELLRPRLRVLDAGCGTGTATFALLEALQQKHSPVESIDGFDLTPAMLARFQSPLASMKVAKVRLLEANVLDLERLPPDWTHYDLVISAAMLDYVPRPELPRALAALRARLAPDGSLLIFISRKTWVNRFLIERLWKANCYTREQLEAAFQTARLANVRFKRFPAPYFWQNWWGHIVLASSAPNAGATPPATN